jgi:hypothetical protein
MDNFHHVQTEVHTLLAYIESPNVVNSKCNHKKVNTR